MEKKEKSWEDTAGPLTTREQSRLLDKVVLFHVALGNSWLYVGCTIDDYRYNWGRHDVLLKPVSGGGEKWADINSIPYYGDMLVEKDEQVSNHKFTYASIGGA